MAKVVSAVWGMYSNATLAIQQQGWFEEKFLEEQPFWEGGGLLCGVNWKIIQLFRSIQFAKCPFSNNQFLQIILALNMQCGKELKSSLSPKQQRRPLPLILYKSFFYECSGETITKLLGNLTDEANAKSQVTKILTISFYFAKLFVTMRFSSVTFCEIRLSS